MKTYTIKPIEWDNFTPTHDTPNVWHRYINGYGLRTYRVGYHINEENPSALMWAVLDSNEEINEWGRCETVEDGKRHCEAHHIADMEKFLVHVGDSQ